MLGLIVLGVLRRLRPVLESVEGAGASQSHRSSPAAVAGSKVPDFTGVTADGVAVRSSDLWNRTAVVLFVNPGCRPCHNLLAELSARPDPLGGTALLVITPSPVQTTDNRGIDAQVLADPDRRISQALGVSATPAAMTVDLHGRVAFSLRAVNTLQQLQALITAGEPHQTPVPVPPPGG
ncbi:peroxiredoxin family protein [Streptomyces sp. NPDC001903]|uniref:peroxiredoxin family protein n=1 Tax=Streptomyces sp. NPDC001903 TaxID=3364622 RepID=UPI003673AD30